MASAQSHRVQWLGTIAVLLFVTAIVCGMMHPFGAETSEAIGVGLLFIALLCVMACRL